MSGEGCPTLEYRLSDFIHKDLHTSNFTCVVLPCYSGCLILVSVPRLE